MGTVYFTGLHFKVLFIETFTPILYWKLLVGLLGLEIEDEADLTSVSVVTFRADVGNVALAF